MKFVVKTARLILAMAYSDPELTLQELGTYGDILDRVDEVSEGSTESATVEFRNLLEMVKLDTMAEVGLVSEFASQAKLLVPQAKDPNHKLAMLFAGFRMSLRQQQPDQALLYLQQARDIAQAEHSQVQPVSHFFIATAGVQQRMAAGESLNDSQIIKEFQSAWGHLKDYNPNTDMSSNTAWQHGRFSARFWISQLADLGATGEPHLKSQIGDFERWMSTADMNAGAKDQSPFSELDRIQGGMTLALTGLDVILYILEVREDLIAKAEASGTLDGFDGMLDQLVSQTAALNLNIDEPGFPPFNLSESAFISELRTRSRFIRGIDPAKTPEQRLALLQNLEGPLNQLRLPGSYIRYQIELGRAYQVIGRSDLSVAPWERAVQRAESAGFLSQAVEAASLLATEYGAQENWERAVFYAAKANQGIRAELGSADALSVASQSNQLSSLEAKAHLKSNNPQLALAALSQGHQTSTAAVQLRGNQEAYQAKHSLNVKERQVATLAHKVKELQEMPISKTRDQLIDKAQTLLAESKSDFLLQSRNIRKKFSRLYTTTLRFDPLNLPDIQKSLPDDAAVVQYFATDEELYIFVVTRTQFRLRSVPTKKAELDAMVTSYVKGLPRQLTKPAESAGLYQTLIAPIEGDIQNSSILVLIPSGKLNILPFAALQDADGETLLEKKTLLELAKTTDFMKIALSEPKQVSKVVAFANATLDLPSAEEEGKNIASIFPSSRLFTKKEATKANLMSFGGQADVLHLATHGTWDASDALKNHLKLANNETLAQEEIFNLNLDETSIVTLSACNTALADTQEIEYVASLAEAFWIAGSKTVIASLWSVEDTSTGILMTKFYERLKAGDGRAQALRTAQLHVKNNPQYSHPYFWSGFLLFGDYR
jgi:CHAT domain-containing protein